MQEEDKKPDDQEDDIDDGLLDEDDDFDFDDFDDDVEDDIEDTPVEPVVDEAPASEPEAVTPEPEDEDSGFSDFDDDDDFDDASWDEYDDDDKGSKKDKKAAKTAVSSGAAGEKSFVAKNFNLIVIGIAVVAGGGWFLMKMSTPQAPTSQTTETAAVEAPQEAEPVKASKSGFLQNPEILDKRASQPGAKEELAIKIDTPPPQPAPINSVAEQAPLASPVSPAPKTSEIEVLTPMPEIGELGQEIKLAALEGNEETIEIAMPRPEAAAPVSELSQAEPALIVETPSQPALLQDKSTMNLTEEGLSKVYEKIAALETQLSKSNDNLAQKIADTDNKIKDIASSLTRLEERLITLAKQKNAPASKPKAAPVKSAAPKATAKAQPTVKPKKISKPQPAKTSKATWKLRSAQPGKALVSKVGSSDFRTVEVGSTLDGVGRITSISEENGKWVVKGTTGQISQ